MGDWDSSVLSGPEGEDWRVPVTELETRLNRLARALRIAALPGALIQHPVDLYYFAGGRQDGSLFVPAEGTAAAPIDATTAKRTTWTYCINVKSIPDICAINTVAIPCMIAVPSILIVAPTGTTKEATFLLTPNPS